MAKNLFVEYVEMSTKSIYKYLKFIFKTSYDEEIAQVYVKTYINSRYYNLSYKENSRVFYLRVKESLAKQMNHLLEENENQKKRTSDYVTYRTKEKIIKDMFSSFDYIYFFDRVRNVENMKKITTIEEVVDKLFDKRQKDYLIKSREDAKQKFLELVKENMSQAEDFLDRYFMDNSFELEIRKYSEKHNLYNIELLANIRMPMIYSTAAINMAFNSAAVKEDRLFAEYTLLSFLIVRDIVELNFRDEYLVEFATSIFARKTKTQQILEIINDPAIQEKMNLKIKYGDFIKNKQKIFELIKQGFKFVLILDNEFENVEEIRKLQMFSYIIVGKHLRCYKQIAKKYKKEDKIIYE